jgi:hypothetical protein
MEISVNTTSSTRPMGITITSWLWIVAGAFITFGAVMGGVAYSLMRQTDKPGIQGSDAPAGFWLMNLMLQNFGAVLAAQFVIAVVAICAGIDLLRLKSWARSAIEALCWLGVLWTIGFGIYWVYMWISMSSQMPSGAVPAGGNTFQVMGVVMGIVATLMFAIPLGIMIRYLRGHEVRGAIAGHTPAYS